MAEKMFSNCNIVKNSKSFLPIVEASRAPVNVSFEFFPPKTDKMNEKLWECIKRLEPLSPSFVSVTYGAGGSTRERTHETVVKIKKETDIEPAAHLTCIGSSKEDIKQIANTYWNAGIKHIVALRGDIPEGETLGQSGYNHANELVLGLKEVADFEISVAAYPETHPEAKSPKSDLDYLKRKIDCGATRAITQFFIDVDAYKRFMDRVLDAGITIPIVPGILPITNFSRTVEFAKANNASVPKWAYELFDRLDDDPKTRQMVAASLAIEQCRALQRDGINDFHFYTLNRADFTYAICHVLGVRDKR